MDKVSFAFTPRSESFVSYRSYSEALFSCWKMRPESDSYKSNRGSASKKWRAALNKRISDRLSPDEVKLLNVCNQFSAHGREAAVSDDLSNALRCFALASRVGALDQLSAEGRLLASATREASEAYLDFCCSDFEQAAMRLERALSFNAELEFSYQYGLLFAQRIHLIGNLVRVRAFSGRLDEAMKLASNLFIYLSGYSDEMPGYWLGKQREAIGDDVIEWQTAQVLSEVALLSGMEETQSSISDINSFFFNPSVLSASNFWSSELHDWFILKRLFLSGELEHFLSESLLFLEKGQQQWPLFWFITMIDAARACLDDVGRQFREQIKRAASAWNYVPRAFRGKLLVSSLSSPSEVGRSSTTACEFAPQNCKK